MDRVVYSPGSADMLVWLPDASDIIVWGVDAGVVPYTGKTVCFQNESLRKPHATAETLRVA